MRISRINLCLLLVLEGFCGPSLTFAQSQQLPSAQKGKTVQRSEMGWLKEPPTMPGIPVYTGKTKYLRGCVNENELGSSYFCTFNAKEERSEILRWYESALPSYNWKVERGENSLLNARHKDGHTLTIMVSSPQAPNKERLNSSFTIVYQVMERHK